MAGAGVIGVAIGFGSQTLVKDFLTGLFIILENTIAVGDNIKIGEHGGVVESIAIRTVRLRDANGALHIIPFSEITRLINQTKIFSFAVIDIGVAYDSNLRLAMNVMRDVGVKMTRDAAWQDVILDEPEVLGIEQLGDFSITLRCRIKTKAGKQWDVKREYMLRIKERFDIENIEIPFPTVMHIHQNDSGKALPERYVSKLAGV
jgi:small conductance mechanosensitive channel